MENILKPPINYEQLETWKEVIESHVGFERVNSYKCNHEWITINRPDMRDPLAKRVVTGCSFCGTIKKTQYIL